MAGDSDDIRTFYDRKFIQAFDLKGKDVTITIAGVRKEKLRGSGQEAPQSKAILKIEGREMEFVPCKTDATTTIVSMYGRKVSEWVGQRITIYPTTCMAFGKQVECIRVRPTKPNGAPPKGREPGED
jgi:hypothetical protein